MRKLGYNIIYLIQLIRYFGFADGASIFFKIIFAKTTIRITSKKFRNEVEIRKMDSDLPIFYQVFAELQYDISYFLKYKPQTIIDCGANVGYASLYFKTLFPEAQIVAVEPQGNNFAQLNKNVSGYNNIKTINAAIWHRDAEISIKNEGQMSAGFEMQEATQGGALLKGVTIDDIAAAEKFGTIDILKIDIEGSEFELFANNPHSWLSKTRCLIIELHDNLKPGISKLFFKEMSVYNWETYIKGENIICLKAD